MVRIDEVRCSLSTPRSSLSIRSSLETHRSSRNVQVQPKEFEENNVLSNNSAFEKQKSRRVVSSKVPESQLNLKKARSHTAVSKNSAPSKPLLEEQRRRSAQKLQLNTPRSPANPTVSCLKKSLQECLKALVHATLCPYEGCNLKFCRTLKSLGQHMRICQKKNGGTCRFCKQFTIICFQHAKTCTEIRCLVPSCLKIRSRMMLMQSGDQPPVLHALDAESSSVTEQLRQPIEIEMSDATEAFVEASLRSKGNDNLFDPTYKLPDTFGTPRQFVAYADILQWLESHPPDYSSPSVKSKKYIENGGAEKEVFQRGKSQTFCYQFSKTIRWFFLDIFLLLFFRFP